VSAKPPPPAQPSGAGRYTWYLGILALILLAYILVNTLRTEGNKAPSTGTEVRAFAAPLVLAELDGDANVATKDNLGDAGKVPACTIKRPDVLTVCPDGRPLVLGFYFTRGSDCAGSFDAMERLQDRYPGVRFAGVIVRGDRDEARKVVREHGWTFPVAYDRDGAVANVYGVPGCPQVVLADGKGRVAETLLGRDRAERELAGHVADLAGQ
jgi:peroxiredoxin